jgi:hypothetical protein
MFRPCHYSPAIERFLVSVLYHEARHRRMPMTRLTNEIIKLALANSVGWQLASQSLNAPAPRRLPGKANIEAQHALISTRINKPGHRAGLVGPPFNSKTLNHRKYHGHRRVPQMVQKGDPMKLGGQPAHGNWCKTPSAPVSAKHLGNGPWR